MFNLKDWISEGDAKRPSSCLYREGKAVKHVYMVAEDETEAVEQLYQAVEIRAQRSGKL
jgi:hypothetical protein